MFEGADPQVGHGGRVSLRRSSPSGEVLARVSLAKPRSEVGPSAHPAEREELPLSPLGEKIKHTFFF